MADDYLHSAGVRLGQQSVAYSRSGVLLAGSALARTKQTKEQADRGAARLRMAATNVRQRGRMLSKATLGAPVKPAFVPIRDAVRDAYEPKMGQYPFYKGRIDGKDDFAGNSIPDRYFKQDPVDTGTGNGGGGNQGYTGGNLGGAFDTWDPDPWSYTIPGSGPNTMSV